MSKNDTSVEYTVKMQLNQATVEAFKAEETVLATVKVDVSGHPYGDYDGIPVLIFVKNKGGHHSIDMKMLKEKLTGRGALEFEAGLLIQPIDSAIVLFYKEALTDIQNKRINNRINKKHPCGDECEHARAAKKDPYKAIFEQTYDVPMKDIAVEMFN